MNEFEKGFRAAQEKIIGNMSDLEGERFDRYLDRAEKIIELPAKEIGCIIEKHKAAKYKAEFEQIVSECNSNEEIVHRLQLAGFTREFIKRNLEVTDEFITHCLNDDSANTWEIYHKIYQTLKAKDNHTYMERQFCEMCMYKQKKEKAEEHFKLLSQSLMQ